MQHPVNFQSPLVHVGRETKSISMCDRCKLHVNCENPDIAETMGIVPSKQLSNSAAIMEVFELGGLEIELSQVHGSGAFIPHPSCVSDRKNQTSPICVFRLQLAMRVSMLTGRSFHFACIEYRLTKYKSVYPSTCMFLISTNKITR